MATNVQSASNRRLMSIALAVTIAAFAALSFAAPKAGATTYNYCVNALMNYTTQVCYGPRHTLLTNSATAVSPTGAYVCENAGGSTSGSGFVNGWKCANGYVSRTYAGRNIYYPAISYGPFRNTGGTSPENARMTGTATY